MNTTRIAFALSQNELPPIEHLALIAISDSCDEFFSFDQAVAAICKATSINETDARAAVSNLYNNHLLDTVEGSIKNYFVMVYYG